MISAAVSGFIGVLVAFILMAPESEDVVAFSGPEDHPGAQAPADEPDTVSERINNSRILNYLIVLLGLIGIVTYFMAQGFNLELNIINFIFLIVGIALHGSPAKYARCITDGIPAASGIVLQFPFYAGIIGMMGGAGLIVLIGEWFASISTEATFPLFAYISAMIVNIFVPSAGGQWQIQGPVLVEGPTSAASRPDVDAFAGINEGSKMSHPVSLSAQRHGYRPSNGDCPPRYRRRKNVCRNQKRNTTHCIPISSEEGGDRRSYRDTGRDMPVLDSVEIDQFLIRVIAMRLCNRLTTTPPPNESPSRVA